jgi:hypothetical protein
MHPPPAPLSELVEAAVLAVVPPPEPPTLDVDWPVEEDALSIWFSSSDVTSWQPVARSTATATAPADTKPAAERKDGSRLIVQASWAWLGCVNRNPRADTL